MTLASAAQRKRNDVLPRLELSYLRLEEVRPSARKLRNLDPAHVREVAAAIGLLGFCSDHYRPRQGAHSRRGALRGGPAIGPRSRPMRAHRNLSRDEQRVLRLAVNRLAEKGPRDLDALKIEFEELMAICEQPDVHVEGGPAPEAPPRGKALFRGGQPPPRLT